ncbi:hypothetical protein HAX54_010354 [Datura stramonium]|uniref:Uncharacterized protein n=1 Tax=Datura stramonium TaxID=4076 RepID=A0ABS8RWS2_DATST|nr:hypothetical protein [Datura stramonium]
MFTGIVYAGKSRGLISISRKASPLQARGHLKQSIIEDVRIIDSELSEYPSTDGSYKFYGLGSMSESPSYYYPNIVREFYVNYIATLEGQCKKGQKPADMRMLLRIPVYGEMCPSARVAEATIDPAEAAIGTESVSHTTQIPTSTASISGVAIAPLGTNELTHHLLCQNTPTKLKKAQDDILKLQQEQQPQEFSIPAFEVLLKDVPFIDLLCK